jgi:hypothetical protein
VDTPLGVFEWQPVTMRVAASALAATKVKRSRDLTIFSPLSRVLQTIDDHNTNTGVKVH